MYSASVEVVAWWVITRAMASIEPLVNIMNRLLAPDGCPWDRKQTLESLRPYVIEEAHEVVDAIDRGNFDDLREELGDLLLQVVFQAALAERAGHFDLTAVVDGICQKLTRRHPHVFNDASAATAEEVETRWEEIKRQEKGKRGVFEGLPLALPALQRAVRMGDRVAAVGLDTAGEGDTHGPRSRVDGGLEELDGARRSGDRERMCEGLGDALFALCHVAREQRLDPEACLRGTLVRFAERVGRVESRAAERGLRLEDVDDERRQRWWVEAEAPPSDTAAP